MFRCPPVWLVVLLLSPGLAAQADDTERAAQTAAHLLDYVGVDYAGAVQNGKVVEPEEYQEQVEFTAQVATLLQGLPVRPEKARLLADAQALAGLIARNAEAAQVSRAANNLRWAILTAYQVAAAPKTAPDVARGKALYQQHCAACHGIEGRGDGPAAKALEPKPSNFHDRARMAQRSAYGLYNTISLGVAGTAMAGFDQLSEAERWALAFYVAGVGASPAQLDNGRAAWTSGAYAEVFPDLASIATRTPDEVTASAGAEATLAQHWLLAHPAALAAVQSTPIDFSITTLNASFAAYAKGDRAAAQSHAVAAYLEGFELVEASLDNVDAGLRASIEREMMNYRQLLKSGAPSDAVQKRLQHTIELLRDAQRRLNDEAISPAGIFTASLVILLREGLEAILLLAAIVAFVVKTGRRDLLPWVHAGWAAALGLGAITWLAAAYFITISGAHRELTEGVTALVAAAMLIYVGFWLHSRAHAQAWQRYISDQVGRALGKQTLWAMAAVSFLAVYRELFEIILFYQALWLQAGAAGRTPLLGGFAAAAGLLAVAGWAMFRYGVRLPIGPFFSAMSVLLAAMAVIFAGQGIAALQEAGFVGAEPVDFIRVPALGIFPTVQTLVTQLLVAVVIGLAFYAAGRPPVENKAS